jgi:hypothetical protein
MATTLAQQTRRSARGPGRQSKPRPAATAVEAPTDDEIDDLEEPEPAEQPAPAAAAAQDEPEGSNEDFWPWLTSFTTDEWRNLLVYLYRVEPVINRRSAGRPSNLRKFSQPFDSDEIMRTEGSGVYRADVLRRNPTGRYSRIRLEFFEILNMTYPPRIPPNDWVDDPANQSWEWAKGAVKEASAAAASGAANPTQMVQALVDGVERLDRGRNAGQDNPGIVGVLMTGMTTLQTELAKANDPTRFITLMSTLAPKDDGTKAILELMREDRREAQAQILRLEAKLNEPRRSIVEEIKEILPIFDTVKQIVPRATRGAEPSAWTEILSRFVDVLPGAIAAFSANTGNMNPAAAGAFQMPAVPRPAPAAPPLQQAPPPAAPPPAPQTHTPESPDMQAQQIDPATQERYQRIVQTYGQAITEVAMHMVDCFKHQTGYDFRDWIISRRGLVFWRQLKEDAGGAQAGATMTGLSQMNTFLRTQLTPVPDVENFFRQFFTEDGEEDPADLVDEVVPPAGVQQ